MSHVRLTINQAASQRVLHIQNDEGQEDFCDFDGLLFTERPGGTRQLQAKLRQNGVQEIDIATFLEEVLKTGSEFERVFRTEEMAKAAGA